MVVTGVERDVGGGEREFTPHGIRMARSMLRDGRWWHDRPRTFDSAAIWGMLGQWCTSRGRVVVVAAVGLDAVIALGLPDDAAAAAGWERTLTVLTDPPLLCCWRRGGQRLDLVTAETLIPTAAALPDAADDAIWIMRDRVMWLWWWIGREGLGRRQLSIGGQALEAYRAGHVDGLLWASGSQGHLDLARRAFVGGRAAAFQLGRRPGPRWLLDMSGAYRAIMGECRLPVRSASMLTRPSLEVLRAAVSRDCVIASVEVDDADGWWPREGRPADRYRPGLHDAVLCTPELADALSRGAVASCAVMATWSAGRPLQRWAERMRARREGLTDWDPPWVRGYLKAITNALFGRLGLQRREWQPWDEAPTGDLRMWAEWEADEQRWVRYRQLGRTVERESQPDHHPWGAVAVSAHIASECRVRLRRLVERAGAAEVEYLDTDGAIVTEGGYVALAESGLWDDLHLRVDAQGECEIRGVRDFDCGMIRRAAGVPTGRVAVTHDGGRTFRVRHRVEGYAQGGDAARRSTGRYIREGVREWLRGR